MSAESARRSASGNSTASHASSSTEDHGFAIQNRFARLRDSTASESGSRHSAQGHDDFNNIASLQTYNDSKAATTNMRQSAHFSYPARSGAVADTYSNHTISRPNSRQEDLRERTGTPQLGEMTGTEQEKEKKRSGNSTAANEKELRDMLEKNQGRDLLSIAQEVRNSERSQKSERAKQLYAMRWLQRCCRESAGSDSVPRNRVYTFYAQRCGNDRVDTLNPASFGKLVRIIFPGIQTRRLGQRGESKYHYVKLILMDEQEAANAARAASPHDFDISFAADDYDYRPASKFPADTTAFPNDESSFAANEAGHPGDNSSHGLVYAPSSWQEDYHNNGGPRKYSRRLKFTSTHDLGLDHKTADSIFTLPDITPFLPPGADVELADALAALYRTHCTMLVDNMRYVKEKSFFKLFNTFVGTLTNPVARLFNDEALAPWIKLCDWHVYREIIRFVSPLALQVMPTPVWTLISRVKSELTTCITRGFQNCSLPVLQAKLEPATIFSKLLERMLRVNETAHAAANLLMNDQMRLVMWSDWVKSVHPRRIAETEIPACGCDEAVEILTTEIRGLLEPLDESMLPETAPEFDHARFQKRFGGSEPSSADVVERWSIFLQTLPERFTQANARTLLYAISAIGSAALRDITVAQAQSFGSWWITKCWVDEMMNWLAEMGGFLDARGSSIAPPTRDESQSIDNVVDAHGSTAKESMLGRSNASGLGIDFTTMPTFAPNLSTGGKEMMAATREL